MKREIDALDRGLVSALQIYPRASWAQLAPIFETSESTLSRRWDQLTDDGVVWSSSGILPEHDLPAGQAGFIEIHCESAARERVVDAIAKLPNVFSLVVCAGAHDLAAMIAGESMIALDRYINEHVVTIPGVVRAITTYVSGVVVEGSTFRLGNLTEHQAASVAALRPPQRSITAQPTPAQVAIAQSLAADVRKPAADVARETGFSRAHVQRQIAALHSAPWYLSRIDFSVNDFGLTAVYFWIECSAIHVADVMRFVGRSQGVRLAMPVVSRANVLLSVWLPGLDHISSFEQQLVASVPTVNVLDRWPQIAARKRLGVVLDRYGRRPLGANADAAALAASTPGFFGVPVAV